MVKINESEMKKETRIKRNEDNLRDLWDNIKCLNIQKTKIMASGSITSWQTDGETMETVTDFILLVFKSLQVVTAATKLKDACSLEEK